MRAGSSQHSSRIRFRRYELRVAVRCERQIRLRWMVDVSPADIGSNLPYSHILIDTNMTQFILQKSDYIRSTSSDCLRHACVASSSGRMISSIALRVRPACSSLSSLSVQMAKRQLQWGYVPEVDASCVTLSEFDGDASARSITSEDAQARFGTFGA